jgi:hypothetical protein
MVQGARRRQPRIWRRANEALSSPLIRVEVTGKNPMTKKLLLCCTAIAFAGQAFAQVELKTYADPDGYLDVQKLTADVGIDNQTPVADGIGIGPETRFSGKINKVTLEVSPSR